jgi:phenylacetate-CoA ligase
MPREDLEQLQLKRLKAVVKHAYGNVEFYRTSLDEAKVSPDDIKTLDDVRKLPFTTKEDLRKHYPFGFMAVSLDKCTELHASSGTTGSPITVCYTPHDIEVWSEVMARCLSISGLTRNDIFQNPIPYGLFTGAFGFHYGAQKMGALVVPSGGGQTDRQLQLMKDYGTTFISGVASYAAFLGQKAIERGIDPAKHLEVRNGLFGAEMFSKGLKKRLADIWDMDVHDIYGLTEMCGPGVSTDCDQHDGLHLWEDHFLVEVVDPESLEPVELEEEGELIITTLTKEGMPVLRYRTRDLTFLYDVPVCECGRTHVKHAPIKGRSDDMIIIRGTNIFPSQIEQVVMKNKLVGSNYMLTLFTEDLMDHVLVEVEAGDELTIAQKQVLEKELQREIKAVLTLTPRIKVLKPGGIPKEGIKAKRVIDNRVRE